MRVLKLVTGLVGILSLSISLANSTEMQEQQRAMDVYGCQDLVRVDKTPPSVMEDSIKDFVRWSLGKVLAENPELANHKIDSLGLEIGQQEKIASAISRRVYGLSSIAGNLNCPVLYIEDDITTYLFEDTFCGQKVLETLEGVYGYTAKVLSHKSSCGEGENQLVIDLFYDIEDL
jgi:hypothetical protein